MEAARPLQNKRKAKACLECDVTHAFLCSMTQCVKAGLQKVQKS